MIYIVNSKEKSGIKIRMITNPIINGHRKVNITEVSITEDGEQGEGTAVFGKGNRKRRKNNFQTVGRKALLWH